jgi:hypothetical protein
MIYVTTVYVGTDDWTERGILGVFDSRDAARYAASQWMLNGGPDQLNPGPEPYQYAGGEALECDLNVVCDPVQAFRLLESIRVLPQPEQPE